MQLKTIDNNHQELIQEKLIPVIDVSIEKVKKNYIFKRIERQSELTLTEKKKSF